MVSLPKASFRNFLTDIRLQDNQNTDLKKRYAAVTKILNKKFYDSDSDEEHGVRIGSFGRKTGIEGISDLDMLFVFPPGKEDFYKSKPPYQFLKDVKEAFEGSTYSRSEIKADQCVVSVQLSDGMHMDIQPVFKKEDGNFKYPYTHEGGSWKTCKPNAELKAVREIEESTNGRFRQLCRIIRAWKENKDVSFLNGLLIDTFVYRFFKEDLSRAKEPYDIMIRDFLDYLARRREADGYFALGSEQCIPSKGSFRNRARKGYQLAEKAIACWGKAHTYKLWRELLGNKFYEDTEEAIESKFSRVSSPLLLEIKCEVKLPNGTKWEAFDKVFDSWNRTMGVPTGCRLKFSVELPPTCPGNTRGQWKILNHGKWAKEKNMIRGQILEDDGSRSRLETSDFRGEHEVFYYAISPANEIVAEGRLVVPIQ